MSEFIAEQIAKGVYTLSQRRKGKSFIWNVLADILNENETVVEGWVYCRNCHVILKFNGHQSSNLNRHKCCQALKQQATISAAEKKEALEACTAWMIEDCRPFSAISGSGFQKLMQFFIQIGGIYGENVDLKTLLPDSATIMRELQMTAEDTRNQFKSEMIDVVNSGGASATIAMWRDDYVKRNILSVTFHYQNDLKLFHVLLGIKSMDFERSTEDNIAEKINSLFREFGVENTSKIKFVTDQGANIVKALSHNTRLNCSSDLFSNVLKKSFQETTELGDLLQSCKNLVKYLKRAKFQITMPTAPESEFHSTRWTSNFMMFKSIVDNWFNIDELLKEKHESQRLQHINLSTLECLLPLCGDFQFIFSTFHNYCSPALWCVVAAVNKIKEICAPNQEDIAAVSVLKANLVKNMEQIYVPHLSMWHKVAMFLYPPAARLQQDEINEIKEFCILQMKDFENDATDSTSAPELKLSNSPSTSLEDISTILEGDFFFKELLDKAAMMPPENLAKEVESYMSLKVPLTNDFNLLEWWQRQSLCFPLLSKFALQVHSIPASIATAEQSMSLAGNLITEKRSGPEPKTFNNLLFLHSFHKSFKSKS